VQASPTQTSSMGLNLFRSNACNFPRVIPEIDIWRAANLMLKRYGEKALEQTAIRTDELASDGDHDGAATWRRIANAIVQLANKTPPGPGIRRKAEPAALQRAPNSPERRHASSPLPSTDPTKRGHHRDRS